MNLWHASDRGDLRRFEPRVAPASDPAEVPTPIVWAVAESRLDNYLLPRDCPRVCLRTGDATTDEDRLRFFGASSARVIIAMESSWLERARTTPIWLYRLPSETFACRDANAGYFTSQSAVEPLSVEQVASPLERLLARGVELRVLPRLRPFAELVAASTAAFSIIRLRNAAA